MFLLLGLDCFGYKQHASMYGMHLVKKGFSRGENKGRFLKECTLFIKPRTLQTRSAL